MSKFDPRQSKHYKFTPSEQTRKFKPTKRMRKEMKRALSVGNLEREQKMEVGAGKILGFISSPYLEPCLNVTQGDFTHHFNKHAEVYHFSHNNNHSHASASDRSVAKGKGLPIPRQQMLKEIHAGVVTQRYA